MNLNLVNEITKNQLRDVPEFRAGCTVRVHVNIKEGDKSRIQIFEGLVIKTSGVGVERTFPVHSPVIAKIEVLRRGKVRRARLFYLRGRSGKASRIKEVR